MAGTRALRICDGISAISNQAEPRDRYFLIYVRVSCLNLFHYFNSFQFVPSYAKLSGSTASFIL